MDQEQLFVLFCFYCSFKFAHQAGFTAYHLIVLRNGSHQEDGNMKHYSWLSWLLLCPNMFCFMVNTIRLLEG